MTKYCHIHSQQGVPRKWGQEDWAMKEAREGRGPVDWGCDLAQAVFKIEVFNALQMRFGPSKYTPLEIAL